MELDGTESEITDGTRKLGVILNFNNTPTEFFFLSLILVF